MSEVPVQIVESETSSSLPAFDVECCREPHIVAISGQVSQTLQEKEKEEHIARRNAIREQIHRMIEEAERQEMKALLEEFKYYSDCGFKVSRQYTADDSIDEMRFEYYKLKHKKDEHDKLFQSPGLIRSSNLCTEIVEYTSDEEILTYDLGSVNISSQGDEENHTSIEDVD